MDFLGLFRTFSDFFGLFLTFSGLFFTVLETSKLSNFFLIFSWNIINARFSLFVNQWISCRFSVSDLLVKVRLRLSMAIALACPDARFGRPAFGSRQDTGCIVLWRRPLYNEAMMMMMMMIVVIVLMMMMQLCSWSLIYRLLCRVCWRRRASSMHVMSKWHADGACVVWSMHDAAQSCPRVTFLGPDPTRRNLDPTRPDPRLQTKSLTRPDPTRGPTLPPYVWSSTK